uniref:NADH-ubiquinone oxidoreductase chain 5 n=1 Tax=Metacrangonyx panousei TaxID=1199244 RepID=K7ZW18_9CRUS|nr:NADH dehydrogenase subunit 5 [Metacrangonyx panousei]CCI69466.1 NADH dehydrogenase subunit 5 [Metacrangonyx panousei]
MKMKQLIYYVYMIIMILISLLSLMLFIYLMKNNKSIFLEWEFFFFNSSSIIFLIMLDWMSCVFMFTVSLISAVISGYSKYYMDGDKLYERFMIILMLFVSSMMLLILSPNLISLLLGWDGLGLSSYILVIYYQNEYACNSGMLTVLSNRIGDATLLMSICLMYCSNSWNFLLEDSQSKFLLVLLILSAITKSAQIPFSAWLPAAMAAPTPVSALVHSSTLVTAGVFLLIRFFPCFYDKFVYLFLLVVSALTMIMSGWMANFEMDMKKIIALSTLSQLGIMMMIVSLGMPELAFFHLITHAMFKSTIFMCAGIMIHNMSGSQDLRLTSNFFVGGPFLGLFFSISNMSLCGFPFLAGFFSKDLLLENILSYNMNLFFHLISMIGTGLTITYSLRTMYYMSSMPSSMTSGVIEEMSTFLVKILVTMIIMSVGSGFFFYWSFILMKFSFVTFSSFNKFYIIMTMIMFFFMMYMNMMKKELLLNVKLILLKKSYYLMMFLPIISAQFMPKGIFKESVYLNKIIDSGWLEYLWGLNLYKNFKMINYSLIFSQMTGFLKVILITMFSMILILSSFM